jgi:hypothetical protein
MAYFESWGVIGDILITCGAATLIHLLYVDFAIKDLGPLHFFLNMIAILAPDGLFSHNNTIS